MTTREVKQIARVRGFNTVDVERQSEKMFGKRDLSDLSLEQLDKLARYFMTWKELGIGNAPRGMDE